jgi:hypothetical protein
MARGAAEVHEAALGEQDDALAVGEDDVIDLRLDVLPLVLASDATSISLSKWPMLQTMAWSSSRHVVVGDHVAVARRGDEDVACGDARPW